MRLLEWSFQIPSYHEAGYICAALFIIPCFPFITSFIDMAKLDLRFGMERLMYALITIVVVTLTAWVTAMVFHFAPDDFAPMSFHPMVHFLLRVGLSFVGVFGFALVFNSTLRLATFTGLIGALCNTLRLELLDFTSIPVAAAAFIAALTAGLLASVLNKRQGYPRITITVPSIIIMMPGVYLYRVIYNLGMLNISEAAYWLAFSSLIIFALPLGLILARALTDKDFRYCS